VVTAQTGRKDCQICSFFTAGVVVAAQDKELLETRGLQGVAAGKGLTVLVVAAAAEGLQAPLAVAVVMAVMVL
jgi:hypothetical protein